MRSFLLLSFLALSGCNTGAYTITKTELLDGACSFTVEFPEDYREHERGTQVFVVEPRLAMQETSLAWKYTLEGQSEGIGADLRRRCGGFLLEPAPRVPVKVETGS